MYGDFAFEFVGTCTRDRELGQLRNGQDRCTVSVAVNKPFKNRDTGEFEEKTTWVRFAVFGDRANSAALDRCRKGMPVYVRGTVESYNEEIGGRNYTMFNFRPDVIRPLLSLDALEMMQRARYDRREQGSTDMPQHAPPEPASPPAEGGNDPAMPPPRGGMPDNDAAGHFED
jgi:single-strand DNA-binding protein